jgi:hypothetical protein
MDNPLDHRTLARAVHYEIGRVIRVGIGWWEVILQFLKDGLQLET